MSKAGPAAAAQRGAGQDARRRPIEKLGFQHFTHIDWRAAEGRAAKALTAHFRPIHLTRRGLATPQVNRFRKQEAAAPAEPPAPTISEKLLIEIRDLLKAR